MEIIQKYTPNHSQGRGSIVKSIMIHIAQGTMAGMEAWFANPASKVSAHYAVGKNGEVHQYVGEVDTAWHAGGLSNPMEVYKEHHGNNPPNPFTIGIEHEGFTGEPFTEKMLESTRSLMFRVAKRYGWSEYVYGKNILEHATVNQTSRGQCPGTGVHMTNDLINRVNNLLKNSMKDQELVELYKRDRPAVLEDEYYKDRIREHFAKWGHGEYRYGHENGARRNRVLHDPDFKDYLEIEDYSPDGLLKHYKEHYAINELKRKLHHNPFLIKDIERTDMTNEKPLAEALKIIGKELH